MSKNLTPSITADTRNRQNAAETPAKRPDWERLAAEIRMDAPRDAAQYLIRSNVSQDGE